MKKLKLNFFILLSILFIGAGCNSYIQRSSATEQIINLKERGCLIVRLMTNQAKADKLIELGFPKMAKFEIEAKEKRNKELIEAFNQQFDFCPVYFTYSNNSNKIREHNLEAGIFLDDSLNIDPVLEPICDYFLTSEFSFTKKDTLSNFDQNLPRRKDQDGWVPRARYDGDSNSRLKAMIIMSDQFIQLHNPFPFYSRKYFMVFENDDKKMIATLNEKLHKFYAKETIGE